jgi:hypothetical protein
MLSTTLRDVQLTTPGHDFDLRNGTFTFTKGIDGVAQAIDFNVRMHRGEWFMDLTKGIPYFVRDGVTPSEALLGQKDANIDQRAIAAYTSVILATEGVGSIVSISATFANRALSVAWTVTVQFDDIATITLSGTTLVQR